MGNPNPAGFVAQDTLSAISRQEYDDFNTNYGDLENKLISRAKNDTSLISGAREDSANASVIAKGIAARNASRYGIDLSPDQIKQQQAAIQRGSALNTADAVNNAQVEQRTLNDTLASQLIQTGQNVNASSKAALAQAAANETQLNNAYVAARGQAKASNTSTVGSLAAAAILAIAMF